MRNPRRDKLEYLLYATVMTGTTVALGLLIIFGQDENGQRRKPVMDQPFTESLREANLELNEMGRRKYDEGERWADSKGYGDLYRSILGGGSKSSATKSTSTASQPQQQAPPPSFLDTDDMKNIGDTSSNNSDNNAPKRWWA